MANTIESEYCSVFGMDVHTTRADIDAALAAISLCRQLHEE